MTEFIIISYRINNKFDSQTWTGDVQFLGKVWLTFWNAPVDKEILNVCCSDEVQRFLFQTGLTIGYRTLCAVETLKLDVNHPLECLFALSQILNAPCTQILHARYSLELQSKILGTIQSSDSQIQSQIRHILENVQFQIQHHQSEMDLTAH